MHTVPSVADGRALPKVELHCHLEGAVRPSTVDELAARHGIALPAGGATALYRFASLDEFIAAYGVVRSVIREPDDWSRIAREAALDAAAAGIVYREQFFSPAPQLAAGAETSDILAGVDHGLLAAEREADTRIALICNVDRGAGGDAATALVNELVRLRERGAPGANRLVGIGMDGTERGANPADFVAAFSAARDAGLGTTGHLGESSDAASVRSWLDAIPLDRIDHGVGVMDDAAFIRRLADARTPINVCPTSNVRIARRWPDVESHPFRRMRGAGLLVTLNSDDPGMLGNDLANEYAAVASAQGLTRADLVAIALDGVEASWASPTMKADLRARIEAAA